MNFNDIEKLASDRTLMRVGGKAIQDARVEIKERLSAMRNDGLLCINEADIALNSIIHVGHEQGIVIALKAIAAHLRHQQEAEISAACDKIANLHGQRKESQ